MRLSEDSCALYISDVFLSQQNKRQERINTHNRREINNVMDNPVNSAIKNYYPGYGEADLHWTEQRIALDDLSAKLAKNLNPDAKTDMEIAFGYSYPTASAGALQLTEFEKRRLRERIATTMKSAVKQFFDGVMRDRFEEKELDDYQILQIKKGIENGVDISVYDDARYDDYQMCEIRLGLENGVDVTKYNNREYKYDLMRQIRFGLESGLKVDCYCNPFLNSEQMEQIRLGLISNVDVSIYADERYSSSKMQLLREGLEKGYDVSLYADPAYDPRQMILILRGLEEGLDVTKYTDPNISGDEMLRIKNQLKENTAGSRQPEKKGRRIRIAPR